MGDLSRVNERMIQDFDVVYINTSPASPAPNKCIQALLRRWKSVYKYLSGAGKVFLNTSQATPAPERYMYQISICIEILLRRRRSIYTYFFGVGEVLIYTYLAPERPEKYLYTPL